MGDKSDSSGYLGLIAFGVIIAIFMAVNGILFMGMEVVALGFTSFGVEDPITAWVVMGALLGASLGFIVGLRKAGRKKQAPEWIGFGALVVILILVGANAAAEYPGGGDPPFQTYSVQIRAQELNVRPSATDRGNQPIGRLPRGDIVRVYDEQYSILGKLWLRIQYRGGIGWISGSSEFVSQVGSSSHGSYDGGNEVGESEDPDDEPPVIEQNAEAQVIAFFDRWKSTGEATDEEWLDMARLTSEAASFSPSDRHAKARSEYALGQVAQRRGETRTADSRYAAASNWWPEWPLPINGRGKIAAQRGDYSTAAHYYRHAIEADPNWLFPRTNLVGTLINLRRYDQVTVEAHGALAINWNSAYAHYALAIAHGRARRYSDAISEGETALRLDPHGSTGFNPTRLRSSMAGWRASNGGSPTTHGDYPRRVIVDTPDDGFLSLRTVPSVNAGNRIVAIPHRTELMLSSCQDHAHSVEGERGNWCRTTYAGRSGWVFDGYLR